ncbi:hypothetical protein GGX14DRAFT_588300 [Mycena pura]|uniref:Uncharacterized protein n=1 Tax=Mycena pura TaxID=153505 RepID=A0AAD6USM4_9AGAR|nr:hypothetical protein GGX14DRAFT_588300 [Mycena pura]
MAALAIAQKEDIMKFRLCYPNQPPTTLTFTPPCPVRPKFATIESKRGTVQEDAREMNERATGTRSPRAAQAGLHRRRAYNLSVSHDVQVAESWVSDDGIQEVLTIAESSSTTFATTSVDGGTNMQNLSLTGEEAVRPPVGLATGVPVVFGEDITDGVAGFLDAISAKGQPHRPRVPGRLLPV